MKLNNNILDSINDISDSTKEKVIGLEINLNDKNVILVKFVFKNLTGFTYEFDKKGNETLVE